MTEVPPSRWKVVERDRRLVVIDTRADPAAASPTPARDALPRRIAFDGTREWTTRPFYDAKAPRLVRVSGDELRQVAMAAAAAPVVLGIVVFVAGAGALAIIAAIVALGVQHGKPWLTRRLDRAAVDR